MLQQINKKIISGSNGLGGEWSLNQMPDMKVQNLKSEEKIDFSNRIEGFLSGKSIEKNFYLNFKKKMTAKEIFFNYKKKWNKSKETNKKSHSIKCERPNFIHPCVLCNKRGTPD